MLWFVHLWWFSALTWWKIKYSYSCVSMLSFHYLEVLIPHSSSSVHIAGQLVRPLLWSSTARSSLPSFCSTCSWVGTTTRDPERLEYSHLFFNTVAFSMTSPNVFLNQCSPEMKWSPTNRLEKFIYTCCLCSHCSVHQCGFVTEDVSVLCTYCI